ncbi:MAG: hypothetical protein JOZ77_08060 [Candidatus Eremiobacteraeota bacterium]|nr:hypothetical protein [Candidatus Eremiobacteraeota bacterium]
MQLIVHAWHRFLAIARECYLAARAIASTYPIYAAVVVALATFAACELASNSVASKIDERTLQWSPGWILVSWMAIGLATGAAVHVVFWLLLTPYRRHLRDRHLSESRTETAHTASGGHSHEIAPHFFAVVGVIYAVLVAFVVVTAWQVRARAEELMIGEQHSVDYLFHLNGSLDVPNARQLQFLLRDYAVYTSAEWGQMQLGEPICRDISESDTTCFGAEGAVSRRANILAHCITELSLKLPAEHFYQNVAPKLAEQQQDVLYRQSLRLLQGILENRAERRLRYSERTLQPILWTAFLLGALLLAGMTYFVRGQSFGGQLLRTCALFGMVGMMTAIAVVFDRPFAGTTHVEGIAWAQMVTHFNEDLGFKKSPHLLDACLERRELPIDSDF